MILFSPPRSFEATELEEGEGEHRHERMAMKSLPGSPFKVVEPKLLFQLSKFAQGRRGGGQGQGCRHYRPNGRLWAGRFRLGGKTRFSRVQPICSIAGRQERGQSERVLSDAEVAEIWQAAGEASEPFGPIIRLLILTGQRRGEVAGMTWGELSDDLTIWSLPPERTKKRHRP